MARTNPARYHDLLHSHSDPHFHAFPTCKPLNLSCSISTLARPLSMLISICDIVELARHGYRYRTVAPTIAVLIVVLVLDVLVLLCSLLCSTTDVDFDLTFNLVLGREKVSQSGRRSVDRSERYAVSVGEFLARLLDAVCGIVVMVVSIVGRSKIHYHEYWIYAAMGGFVGYVGRMFG